MTSTVSEHEPRLVVSPQKAAKALDCSVDTVERLVERGELDRVKFSQRRVEITWASMLKLIERGVAA